MPIIQLDSLVFNRIAAGEVVDRPASIVKELLENSIDAKASSITVAIKNGGIDLIRVSDNGSGMNGEDLKMAFLPHATSKIKTVRDLENITTLGFRGEALPSIAAVSRVKAVSKRLEDRLGYYIEYDNGDLIESGEAGCTAGTTVSVTELFAKIPARQKFLSPPNRELSFITALIERAMLANYNTAISFSSENKSIVTYGDGIESAVFCVYGREMLNNIAECAAAKNGVKLYGYTSKPAYSKPSRAFQTLIVNGRVVENSEISYQVFNCYSEYLMKRQFPAYVLYIDLPADMVDVNVHPNKTEIKFADLALIKQLVKEAIKPIVKSAAGVPKELNIPLATEGSYNVREYSAATTATAYSDRNSPVFKSPNTFNSILSSLITLNKQSAEPQKEQTAMPQQQSMEIDAEIIIAGDLFNTYTVVQYGNDAYFIDRHAAHEKIIYDKLVKQYDQNAMTVQDLLAPYVFEATGRDKILIEQNIETLKECGFIIEPLSDNYFKLSAVPALVSGLNLVTFVSDLFAQLNNKQNKPQYVTERIMQCACKSAVKGGQELSEKQVRVLLSLMSQADALLCPHGRPAVIRVSRKEIEKWFGRIV